MSLKQIVSTYRNVDTWEIKQDSDMDWLKLDSKMLASVGYDPEKQTLYLRFRTGEVYQYFEFSGADYRAFLNAESRGKYFLANIRDQFRYERLAKLRVA